ncbi:MAG: hypothetical protein QOJ12_3095, partial [Thermoleophilales bacterium]|nr:hypothetical protein [Thermoleophilales bacterium]
MSDYFAVLEQDLVDAARRRSAVRPLRRRPPRRSFLLAAALALLVAGSAMAGTLYILRGDPIPAPAERDAGASQTIEPGSSHVLPQRADDPAGGPPFALRLSRSRTGFVCSTVGQVGGGDFGLVGLDRRFRPFDEGVVDSCGQRRDNAATLIGARVLDARPPGNIRTVVSGVAGPQLRQAFIQVGGDQRRLTSGPDGTFITVVRGYPEDLGIRVVLRFADGHEEDFPLGRSDFVVRDPLEGPAWETMSFSFDSDSRRCVSFQPARQRLDAPVSPAACGRLAGKPNRERGYFFAVRRLRERPVAPRRRGDESRGRWRGDPRTAVWGLTGKDVARIVVAGPAGRREVARAPSGAFLAVYG